MSNNDFLKKYSLKIKSLNPSVSTGMDDWNRLEKRMDHLDRQRKRRYVFFFILLGLVFILGCNYLYEIYSSNSKNADTSNAVAETIQNNKDKTINSASELTDHLPSNVETTENAQPDTFVKIKEVSGGALNKDVKYTLKRNMLKKLRKVNLTLLTYDNTVLAEKDMSTKDDQIKEKSLFDNLSGGENIKLFDK